MSEQDSPLPSDQTPPIAVAGPYGAIRLKWHKLRTEVSQAPFKLSNLALGWKLGASLEIDVMPAADGRLVVLHDPTLGPSTTGRGRVALLGSDNLSGLHHRDASGVADPDAPVLPLRALLKHLRRLPRAPSANLQLDLKVLDGRPLTAISIEDAAQSAEGFESAIVIGSHYLEQARKLAAAMPGAHLGYDPMLAASRDQGLGRSPERMLRHMEKRKAGVTWAYLRYDAVLRAEAAGFRLVRRLLDLGIETDAWTVNPGLRALEDVLPRLADAGVRQITTDAPAPLARQMRIALTANASDRSLATAV
jgi:glycerophosphoryl diester phosphodiesterase